MKYLSVNILDLLEEAKKGDVNNVISSFACPLNDEIVYFLNKNASIFAQKKIAMTYLIFDKTTFDFLGYYTLTNKSISIKHDAIPKKYIGSIERYLKLDNELNYVGPCYLIAQLSKNYAIKSNPITGAELLDDAISHLKDAQHLVGGGFVYLECEEGKPALVKTYEKYGFVYTDNRKSDDGINYKRMLKKI
ncbi:MAG: hypothetical protein J5955_06515 [Bacilli bacterium]|nr:hypothetical protein [Bacilli bacterium]